MKKTLLLGITVGVMFVFSGCATIMSGRTQTIFINNDSDRRLPINIKYSDGMYIGYKVLTPTVISVDRRSKDIILKPLSEKCQPKVLKAKNNDWVAGNIFFGGLIGSTTDAISGAAWKYDDKVNINCSK